MNMNELKAAAIRKGYTIPALSVAIGISKKALYCKIAGTTQFTQREIQKIAEVLGLSFDEIISIFFTKKVS